MLIKKKTFDIIDPPERYVELSMSGTFLIVTF